MKSFLDMLRKSEAKAAVAHRSAPQRHRRTPSVLTKRAPAPSPDAVGGRITLSHTFVEFVIVLGHGQSPILSNKPLDKLDVTVRLLL